MRDSYAVGYRRLPKGIFYSLERIGLVQRYISLFGRETIDCLLADRGVVHQNLKPIRILKHGRKSKSIFIYGLDIVTELLTRGRNNYGAPVFGILSTENTTFTPA